MIGQACEKNNKELWLMVQAYHNNNTECWLMGQACHKNNTECWLMGQACHNNTDCWLIGQACHNNNTECWLMGQACHNNNTECWLMGQACHNNTECWLMGQACHNNNTECHRMLYSAKYIKTRIILVLFLLCKISLTRISNKMLEVFWLIVATYVVYIHAEHLNSKTLRECRAACSEMWNTIVNTKFANVTARGLINARVCWNYENGTVPHGALRTARSQLRPTSSPDIKPYYVRHINTCQCRDMWPTPLDVTQDTSELNTIVFNSPTIQLCAAVLYFWAVVWLGKVLCCWKCVIV
jgi:hypothetical protein